MKYLLNLSALLVVFTLATSFVSQDDATQTEVATDIEWISWEEAVERNEKEPRKIFVDVYTEWCGWCKKMDASTFKDKDVIEMMDGDFYAVKFDAEQKEDIQFQGHTFKFMKGGRRGAHQLASALLDGRLGFPSFVILDETFSRIMLSPGFKQPAELLTELSFAKDEQYKVMSWSQYKSKAKVNKS